MCCVSSRIRSEEEGEEEDGKEEGGAGGRSLDRMNKPCRSLSRGLPRQRHLHASPLLLFTPFSHHSPAFYRPVSQD